MSQAEIASDQDQDQDEAEDEMRIEIEIQNENKITIKIKTVNCHTDQYYCARAVARLRTRISVSDRGNCIDTMV